MTKILNLLLLGTVTLSALAADTSWRKVAFIGDATVKNISGLVEVIAPTTRILHEGEQAKAGETFCVWRGAELLLQMEGTKSLVRAQGPVILRLAPAAEGFSLASAATEDEIGFVVRAVRGQGKYFTGGKWADIKTNMTLPDGTKVRPNRDSILDFYHPVAGQVTRVTDHTAPTKLAVRLEPPVILAARTE